MNKINPKKLLHSKWTAVLPKNKEKHFMVTKVSFDEDDNVVMCVLEAVLSKQSEAIDWQVLKNSAQWQYGWK